MSIEQLHQFVVFNQWAALSYWGGPLLGVQKANVFTAPKMRLLQ